MSKMLLFVRGAYLFSTWLLTVEAPVNREKTSESLFIDEHINVDFVVSRLIRRFIDGDPGGVPVTAVDDSLMLKVSLWYNNIEKFHWLERINLKKIRLSKKTII